MIWRNFLLHFRFAMELNEILESERNHLPKTDTRFRPDQRALEVRKNKLYNFFLWNWMNPKVSFKNISPPWENWNMNWFSWSIDLFSVYLPLETYLGWNENETNLLSNRKLKCCIIIVNFYYSQKSLKGSQTQVHDWIFIQSASFFAIYY